MGATARVLDDVLATAQPVLLKLAMRMCRTREDANDLVQDTLERAARDGIDAEVQNPYAWLTTIMRNRFLDQCRATQRRPVQVTIDEVHDIASIVPDAEEPAWARVTYADLLDAVAQLEPIYREVFTLCALESRPYAEVAARAGISVITVGTRLTRARAKLRTALAVGRVS